MNEITKRWIEAGKVLAADPLAKVPCPNCGEADLQVQDVANPANAVEFERYIRCPRCGGFNVLRMRVR
jgi:predicted RNA-binding Zn-ribbon protein involved in translation (DUF1610 family)